MTSTTTPNDGEKRMKLLTAEDVADCLQISDAMAYLLIQRLEITTVKIGRSVISMINPSNNIVRGHGRSTVIWSMSGTKQ